MMIAFIIGCEIAFWVFVIAGLICRYVLRLPKAGAVLLLCTPLVDLALLVATALHLRTGVEASTVHGLAAIYIGVSIAWGKPMIQWADVRFAHRFAGGPAPVKVKLTGAAHAQKERAGWFRHLLAWIIGCGVLYGMIFFVNQPEQTEQLQKLAKFWTAILGIDFLISFSYTLWPKKSNGTS